jgi:hypothetical protein
MILDHDINSGAHVLLLIYRNTIHPGPECAFHR